MRLPAQSRSVSRSRSLSPISQHPDDGESDEACDRRLRAEMSRITFILAKSSSPAAGHDYNWGLPAFDDTKTLVGFYLMDVDNEIVFWPACVFTDLLPVDLALARYAFDREMEEKSDAVHSLFQYGSVENLRDAAYRYYLRHDKPVLPGPRPSLQIPAHLIYMVPDADFPSLMMLLDNINDDYFELNMPLEIRHLAKAAGPETMDPSWLLELLDAAFALFEPRKIQEGEFGLEFGGLLLDDGQHLPNEALPAFALLRVHAMAFENPSLCCDEPLDLLKYHGTAVERFVVELHGRVHVMTHRSSLRLMIYMIKKAVFDEFGFSRYLAGCGPEFINFLRTFIRAVEQFADGHAPLFTFQIRKDVAPHSSDIVECEHDEAGRNCFVHRKHVGALGAFLQDVWQLHRSKFYMGGLLPDESIDWTSLPPSRPLVTSARLRRQLGISASRPADVAAPVAAIAPGLPVAPSDVDSS